MKALHRDDLYGWSTFDTARNLDFHGTLWVRPEGNVVIVAHGGLFTLTLKDLCRNFDPAILRTRQNHNCSISEVEADLNGERVQATLVDWANVGHISGAAADFEPGSPRKEYYARA